MDEMEEIGQELDRTLRVALTGAGQLAERVSRRTEERLRESRRASTEQAHLAREQLQGEMQAARLIYRPAADRAGGTPPSPRTSHGRGGPPPRGASTTRSL